MVLSAFFLYIFFYSSSYSSRSVSVVKDSGLIAWLKCISEFWRTRRVEAAAFVTFVRYPESANVASASY